MQENWATSGEMWAEMATNYFVNANADSLLTSLFATDAGYIPLPQRIIALLAQIINVPIANIPYFYNWSAITLSALMVGTFCLKPFRQLIPSDLLRFLVAITVLLAADTQSKNFINFTYFAGFFITVITALALVDKRQEISKWSWFIPVLMLSKPAILATLPAMLIVAIVSKKRFRLITLVTLAGALVQIASIKLHQLSGVCWHENELTYFIQINHQSLASYLYTFWHFFCQCFAGFVAGSKVVILNIFLPWPGLYLLVLCGFVLYKNRSNANSLALVSLSMSFFGILLYYLTLNNCSMLLYSRNIQELYANPLSHLLSRPRHLVVSYDGIVLLMASLITSALMPQQSSPQQQRDTQLDVAPLFFVLWFIFSGWLAICSKPKANVKMEISDISQWQSMAYAIKTQRTLCVPITPLGWVFKRNCYEMSNLLQAIITNVTGNNTILFEQLPGQSGGQNVGQNVGSSSVVITPPASTVNKNLISLAVIVKLPQQQLITVLAKAAITMKDGTMKYLYGNNRTEQIKTNTMLLMLTGQEIIPLNKVKSIRLIFNVSLAIGNFCDSKEVKIPVKGHPGVNTITSVPDLTTKRPIIFWFGNDNQHHETPAVSH
jgi:hypothetical protein